ncbi:MAG: hypothetical protein PHN55_16235 [Dysgonamonadaceae bacterium]|nr:hypothetical protein [Dysgonamonadaceae bacterium]
MNILSDAKLFVETLKNDKYLHEVAILMGVRRKSSFYGVPQNVIKYFANPLSKTVFVVIYPVVLIVLIVKNLIKMLIKNFCNKKENLPEGEYYIASSNFSKSINNRINKHIGKACWLLNDGVNPNDYVIPSGMYISSLQVVSISDIFSASVGTFVAYILICTQFGFYYMLCSMNAFKWLMYWKACKQLPIESSLYFVNHKDRWAFLEDHIYSKHKTLIQHGTEVGIYSDDITKKLALNPVTGGGWALNMPYKYQTLSKVIAFTEKEITAMKLSIIGCDPEFVVGGYGFETYPLKSDKFSVLIIAFSGVFFEKEKEIIKGLQELNIDIYVKNHPTQSNEPYLKLQEDLIFTFIKEQRFPHVNLVITYDSTLAHEYKSVGIEVLYHTVVSLYEIKKNIEERV